MRNAQSMIWNMSRKLKNVENETQILFYMDYGKKTEKRAKRNSHYKNWNMPKNS